MTLVLVLLGGWFGFELGRKWVAGRAETVAEDLAATRVRGRIKLRPIRIRR